MSKTSNVQNHIIELSEREHILKRPSMYIGAVDRTTIQEYILTDKKIELQSISYIPGFIKIINEIIDNSVDIAIKTNFKCNQIKVSIAEDYIEVVDNGIGIPVVQSGEKYMPELAWGRARAGSNFSDDANRTQIGMNGIGSFATNCFSKKFIGTSDDGTNRCVCTFTDNALNCKTKVSPSSGKTGVTVKFYPDLEKFGLKSIDETHVSLIKQRLLNLAISYPAIRFTFNKKQITTNSFRKYVTLFQSVPVLYEGKNYSFAVLPNDSDEFRQFSYVNGLRIYEGTHTDVVINNIVSRIKTKLERKYKNIKPADIKNKLFFIAFLKDVKNLKFSSQAKEKITNSVSEINNYFGEIPYDVICKKILGTPEIIDPITEIYRIKEEFKRRQELKQLDKTKKIRNDSYLPSISNQKYLLIVEGQCLEENTEVLTSDFNLKKLKDLRVSDVLLSNKFEHTKVTAITKKTEELITIKTKSSSVKCSPKHPLFVYDTEDYEFKFVKAHDIQSDTKRFKLVKSRLNENSVLLKVTSNSNYIINNQLRYTDDDKFAVVVGDKIKILKGKDIETGCTLIYAED